MIEAFVKIHRPNKPVAVAVYPLPRGRKLIPGTTAMLTLRHGRPRPPARYKILAAGYETGHPVIHVTPA